MRKGITPIISIIVLLLITVALAGVAWTYLSGFMGTYTQGAFSVPPGGVYCSSGTIHVRINNPATTGIAAADFVVNSVSDSEEGSWELTALNVDPKGTADFTTDCGSTCGVGSYTIDIGTAGSIQQYSVAC